MSNDKEKWEHHLRLGHSDISTLTSDLQWGSGIEGNTIRSWLAAALRLEAQALFAVDLRDEITLDMRPSEGDPSRQFSGLVLRGLSGDGAYSISAEDMSVRLSEAKLGGGFGREFTHQEMVYLILSAVEGVDADSALIEGLKLMTSRRMFVFIAPVPGLRIAGDGPVRFADAELYVPERGLRYDDELIQGATPDPPPPELSADVARAYIPVQATGFTEAINAGQTKLRRMLDWMSFRCGLSTPCYPANGGWRYVSWERSDGRTRVVETDWLYVRDTLPVNSKGRYWLRWTPPTTRDAVLELSSDGQARILQTLELLEPLLRKPDEKLRPDERAVLFALHFHRRARQAPDKFDQLVNYWNALEFLLSHLKVPALFSRCEVEQIARQTSLTVPKTSDGDEVQDTLRTERVADVLSKLNDASLRAKWEHFVITMDLHLPAGDEQFTWQRMRRARNAVQHGKVLETIKQSELDHFGCIVEKAILLAANGLPR
ncbi:hypothetical protein LLH23_18150 [bacterium]|nr:hypothetical protein [bacterium]